MNACVQRNISDVEGSTDDDGTIRGLALLAPGQEYSDFHDWSDGAKSQWRYFQRPGDAFTYQVQAAWYLDKPIDVQGRIMQRAGTSTSTSGGSLIFEPVLDLGDDELGNCLLNGGRTVRDVTAGDFCGKLCIMVSPVTACFVTRNAWKQLLCLARGHRTHRYRKASIENRLFEDYPSDHFVKSALPNCVVVNTDFQMMAADFEQAGALLRRWSSRILVLPCGMDLSDDSTHQEQPIHKQEPEIDTKKHTVRTSEISGPPRLPGDLPGHLDSVRGMTGG